MLWNIAVNDAGAEYDPLTLLRSRTMFGRPDWMNIYGRIKQAVEGGQYIPGSNSQLKTKIGVSPNSDAHKAGRMNHFTDLLLWSRCFGVSYQTGDRLPHERQCAIHFLQGVHRAFYS
jgi:hypothetical protein